MKVISIDPHYLPSLEYMSIIRQADELLWDVDSPFVKQTFRNRTYLLTANGVQPLIVPVHFRQGARFKEVTIDYHQSWVREHWGAVYSGYGKAPFFDFYADYFKAVWERKHKYLIDLNHEFLSVSFDLLQWQTVITLQSEESSINDLRGLIHPKEDYTRRIFYTPFAYQQNFGSTFVPNLNVLDLLMCQGPESDEILRKSIQTPVERFKN